MLVILKFLLLARLRAENPELFDGHLALRSIEACLEEE